MVGKSNRGAHVTDTNLSSEARLPGEDAWLNELVDCAGHRDKLRTVLRAFSANLKQQAASPLREALAGLRDKWERNIKHLLEREEYLEAGVVESHIDDLEHILAAHPAGVEPRHAKCVPNCNDWRVCKCGHCSGSHSPLSLACDACNHCKRWNPDLIDTNLREALAGLRERVHAEDGSPYMLIDTIIEELDSLLAAHPAVPTGRQAGVELPETERQADEEREDLRLQRHCSMRSAPQPVQQDGEQEVFTSQGGEFPGWCKHCDKHRSLHRHGGSSHVGEPEYCSNALPPTPGSERE